MTLPFGLYQRTLTVCYLARRGKPPPPAYFRRPTIFKTALWTNRIANQIPFLLHKVSWSESKRTASSLNSPYIHTHRNFRIVHKYSFRRYSYAIIFLTQAQSFASKLASQPTTSESIPIFAFSVGVPYSAPLGMGSRLACSEQKIIGADLRSQFGERLKDHTLFEGNCRKEDLGKGFMGGVLRALWHLGGRYGDFVDWGKVDEWVDGVVVRELGKVETHGAGYHIG